jgi:hypothetical protein
MYFCRSNFAFMKLSKLLKDILNECLSFFLKPTVYWQQVKAGNNKGTFSFTKFFIPALFLTFIFIFAGELIFHSRYGFLWIDALVKATRKVLFLFLILVFSVIIIRMVMKWFKFGVKMRAIRRIATYSATPALVTAVFTGLFPFFDLGGIAPWYGLYLVFTGIETFFSIPEEKKFYFYFVLFMVLFIIIMLLTFTLNRLTLYLIY